MKEDRKKTIIFTVNIFPSLNNQKKGVGMYQKGKKLLLVLFLIFSLVFALILGYSVIGCKAETGEAAAEEPAAEAEGGFYVGHVSIWNVDWYAFMGNAMDLIAKKYDTEIYRIFSDFTVEKEVAGIEDMITRKVDGIILGSVSADSAQQAAQKCNAADIPLVIENSALGEGPGTVVSDVEFDWYGLGVMSAEVTAENWPGSKVLLITGTLGTGPDRSAS